MTKVDVGQRVGVEPMHLVGCGRCRQCRRGDYHICPQRGIRNGQRHGSAGFSELDLVTEANVYPLPDHVSLDAASLLDVYGCGVHAINRVPLLETAGLATLLFLWAARLAGDLRWGVTVALGAAFCTLLWPYAYTGLEPTQSLLLLIIGYLALSAETAGATNSTTRLPSRAQALWTSPVRITTSSIASRSRWSRIAARFAR